VEKLLNDNIVLASEEQREELIEAMEQLAYKLVNESKPLDSDIAKVIDEHFEDML
jgi:hypothetical protein